MNAQSILADRVDFQDKTADHPDMGKFSLLAGFIGFYQDAQRINRKTHRVYAMNIAELYVAGIS